MIADVGVMTHVIAEVLTAMHANETLVIVGHATETDDQALGTVLTAAAPIQATVTVLKAAIAEVGPAKATQPH